jgi:hypothetical protein
MLTRRSRSGAGYFAVAPKMNILPDYRNLDWGHGRAGFGL